METWQIVLLSILGVYVLGFVAMAIALRGREWNAAVLWPITLLWMLVGNIQ